ncbi:hypothetical protein LTR65_000358 [Meristemomyces frigidus]
MADNREREVPELDFDETVGRCTNWVTGDIAELEALSKIVRRLYNSGDAEGVEAMSLALLEHGQYLPALYKAKMHVYLAAIEDRDDNSDRAILASLWIAEARKQYAQIGPIPAEVEEWGEVIRIQKAIEDAKFHAKAKVWRERKAARQQQEQEEHQLALRPGAGSV